MRAPVVGTDARLCPQPRTEGCVANADIFCNRRACT